MWRKKLSDFFSDRLPGWQPAIADTLTALTLFGFDAAVHGYDEFHGRTMAAIGVAAMGVLLLRRRYPATLFVLELLWAWACIAWITSHAPLLPLVVALHATAGRYGARRSLPALVATWTVTTAIVFLESRPSDPMAENMTLSVVLGLLPYAVWTLGHWRATAVRRQGRRTESALREERVRVAREIHDILSHSISTVALYATAARTVLCKDPAKADAALAAIEQACVSAMTELQRLLSVLRAASAGQSPGPQDRDHTGLADLDRLVASLRADGLAVRVESTGAAAVLPPSLDHTAYLIVAESLTNTLRHAGAASTAVVRIAWQPGMVALTVEDTGPAARPRSWRMGGRRMSTGHGLLGLRERVATHGGFFDARRSGPGFTVRAKLPLLLPVTELETT